jgi:hypothetical protein
VRNGRFQAWNWPFAQHMTLLQALGHPIIYRWAEQKPFRLWPGQRSTLSWLNGREPCGDASRCAGENTNWPSHEGEACNPITGIQREVKSQTDASSRVLVLNSSGIPARRPESETASQSRADEHARHPLAACPGRRASFTPIFPGQALPRSPARSPQPNPDHLATLGPRIPVPDPD